MLTMFGRISSTLHRVRTAPLRARTNPSSASTFTSPLGDTMLAPLVKRREAIEVVGATLASSAIILTAALWVMGWQSEVRELKNEMKNIKESLTSKAERTEVENAGLKAQLKAYEVEEGKKPRSPRL
jgi:hypothetical protein